MGVLALPSNAEYQQYLAHPARFLRDAQLRACRPELDTLGLPRVVTGNFAAVFRLAPEAAGAAWAVKCFTRRLPEPERYQRISAALARVRDDWKVHFEFLEEGVLVDGRWLPVLKMEWVQGTGLEKYVQAHLHDPAALSRLAARFEAVVASLERAGMAHGDLQHGNILVAPDGRLRLVDYDGMFVPGLEGLGATEGGHANYQSPLRASQHFGPGLDRFSAWVIYGSLVALSVQPELWDRRNHDDALLFTQADFASPASSMLAHVSGMADERCRRLGQQLQVLCRLDPGHLPPLLDEAPPASGVPEWVRERMAPSPPPAPPPLPAVVRLAFTWEALWFARLTVLLFLAAWCACVVKATGGAGSPAPPDLPGIALLLTFFVACAMGGAWSMAFDRTPVRRARERLRRAEEDLRRAQQLPQQVRWAHESRLQAQVRDLDAEVARERARLEAQADAVSQDHQRIQRDVKQKTTEILRKRDARIAAQAAITESRRRELLALQRLTVPPTTLQGALLALSSIPGIHDSHKTALRSHGFETAADLVGYEVREIPGRYVRRKALLRRRDGTLVYVPGIGPKKAEALLAWRRGLEVRIAAAPRRSVQDLLLDLQRQGDEDKRAAEAEALEAQADLTAWQANKTREFEAERRRLEAQIAQAGGTARARRATLESELRALVAESAPPAATQARIREAEAEVARARTEMASFDHLSPTGFLKALLGG